MANKHKIGSLESVNDYLRKEKAKMHMYFAFSIMGAAILLFHGFCVGAFGVDVIYITGIIFSAIGLLLSVFGYGKARENIVFGILVKCNGISIKADSEGHVLSEVHMDRVEAEESVEGDKEE